MRRILSMLLALVMVFTAIPWAAMAEETQNDTTVDTGEVTVEGTNGFGRLLSADIQEYQEDTAEEYQGGYTVTDLVIEGNTATVTYDALGEANLVVALYTEDGIQLLTSANTTVTADATEATVTFAGEMPEYFLASAYLVDTYDFSPLCEAYDTPMYTQDMQELLASTVEDYDPDRVLQLTEDTTTNFAVYAEGVILIDGADGVNTVASADDENLVYVIENADAQITGLAVGDILVYEYGEEELLIVRVSAITVDGTSVTITGDDTLSMDEAFDIVKVESHTNSDSAEVSDLDAEDGIDFVDDSQTAPLLNAIDGSVSAGKTLSFEIKEKEITSKDGNRKATFSATWDLSLEIEVDYYISWKRSHVELKIDYETALVGSIDGSIEFELKDFASLKIKPVSGVTIKLEPKLELEFSGEVSLSVALSGTLGVKLDTKKNAKNQCTVPKVSVSLEAEGSIFFGISLNPTVTLINKKVTKLTASVPIGLNIEAEADLLKGEIALGTEESIHTCNHCLDISVSVSLKAKAEAKFLNAKKLTVTKTFDAILKEFPFYWSFTENDFGSGSCPHVSYLTSFLVKYKDESYVTEAEVTVTGRDGTEHEEIAFTNKFGTAYFYLPAGKYTATITDGTFTKTTKFTISDEARQKTVTLKEEKEGDSFYDRLIENLKFPDIIDLVTTLASGTCGADLSWKLSGSGMLIISGSGDMDYFSTEKEVPWHDYRDTIKKVTFPNGLSSIGNYAFKNCINLTQIRIPDSVTSLGYEAFEKSGLTYVTVPGSVGMLAGSVFNDCDSLAIVTLENGPVTIQKWAFGDCDSLTSIHIPGSVKYIVTKAFESCDSLETVTMDPGILAINAEAFGFCTALKKVQLSSTLETIKKGAFESCWSLESITLPGSLAEIEQYAFRQCNSITDVYYAGSEESWNAISIGVDNEDLTSATIHYNSTGPAAGTNVAVTQGQAASGEDAPTLDAVYGGEYSTEETESITLKKATFSGLVPGEEYLLLAMASIDTDAPIAPENLLFIDQAAAGEDGTLTFTYVQRVTTDPSFVVACGAASKTLSDAAITFPEMIADGELHAVEPTVVYDGATLQEGRDYEITGTVSYTEAGTYVCYIRGIHNYTGTMKCTYTVAAAEEPEAPTDPTDPEEPTDPEVPTDPVDPEEPELNGVIRIAGDDRIATSLMLADQLKEVLRVEKFDAVVVASALNFPDALTGSYLAAEKDAPILLTYPAAHAKIRAYIQENLKPGGMVYILGGEGAVSADFANGLGGFSIKRLAGSDRFGTNLAIMEEAGVSADQPVLIATAVNFADSLSASAAGLPMVLVYGSLREDQKEFLATTSKNFIIIGGEAAVSPALEAELKAIGSVTRVAGSSRYETSVLVAERFVQNPDAVILAYAKNFPDGLCGGPLAYALGAPLILTDSGASGTADGYVRNITSGIVVGGAGLISDAATRDIFDLAANAEIPQTGR